MEVGGTTAFDPYDWETHYFGPVGRDEATEKLIHMEEGVFLVRDSTTVTGDYVLSVREKERVCHYLISKTGGNNGESYRIGEQTFPDIASLLNFYKTHFLETSPLLQPLPRHLQQVIAKFDFAPVETTDLGFRKSDKLWILRKESLDWWTAKNSDGKIGNIPANRVKLLEAEKRGSSGTEEDRSSSTSTGSRPESDGSGPLSVPSTPSSRPHSEPEAPSLMRKLPTWALVVQDRTPSAYDKTALRLKRGDRIWVTKATVEGTWEGELNGKTGQFPFTHVQFVDDEPIAS